MIHLDLLRQIHPWFSNQPAHPKIMNPSFKLRKFLYLMGAIFAVLLTHVSGAASEVSIVKSPDGKLEVEVSSAADGQLHYSFKADGKLLIDRSRMGLEMTGAPEASPRAEIKRTSVSSVWKPLWGKRAVVPEQYHAMTLPVAGYSVDVRVYNDGFAFRYDVTQGEPVTELTEYAFAGDYTAWFYNNERHNLGPDKLSTIHGMRKPVMTIMAGADQYMALHEAMLVKGEELMLSSVKDETTFRVASAPNMAWRVIMFGRTPGELVDSHLIELLNPPPSEDMDFSWVKPGVATWDWRISGARVEGFRYGMNLVSWKRMVDFSSANGFSHLVLDANWYGPEHSAESNPVEGGQANAVKEIIRYGKEKGVGIWLYLNDKSFNSFPIEETLKQYSDWGAAGIKYGFMRVKGAERVERTRLIQQLCAKLGLHTNFHDSPVHPTGEMRTYPNLLTSEYCFAQLDARKVYYPKTLVTSVFVNMLAGPIDMTNGVMDLRQVGRSDNPMPVPTTLAGEAARTLIVFSGATIIPDIPEYYNRNPEILRFLSAQKLPWLESKTLAGEIGKYIVMARQAADGAWLVGAATDEESRVLEIPLSFLGEGKYEALLIQDGPEADYRNFVEDYRAETKLVDSTSALEVKLAPGGGAALLIQKLPILTHIEPLVDDSSPDAQGETQSLDGITTSQWKLSQAGLELTATIPENRQAIVSLPTLGSPAEALVIRAGDVVIWENDSPATSLPKGITFAHRKDTDGRDERIAWNVDPGKVQFTVTLLAIPGDFQAAGDENTITLTWNAAHGATKYTIQRATQSSGPYQTVAKDITATTYTDTAVTRNQEFFYVIIAENADGVTGLPSPEVSGNSGLQPLKNASFEHPIAASILPNPTDADWNFAKAPRMRGVSGITPGFSPLTSSNSGPPDGIQVAYLQGASSMSQELVGLAPQEKYRITFSAAQRRNKIVSGQTWDVQIDGGTIASFEPPATATDYITYHAEFTATAPRQTLSFVGTNKSGGDNTVFIDKVEFVAVP